MVTEQYVIHEVAKEVNVEAHVLRYWEEELDLPILRNDKGHRVYSEEDIRRFARIKNLRDQGLQLKAVKRVLEQLQEKEVEEPEMRSDNPFSQKQLTKINKNGEMKVIQVRQFGGLNTQNQVTKNEIKMKDETQIQDFQQEKVARMQFLFQKLIKDVIEENNITLVHQLSDNIKEDICKEMDYQFRLFEEREDERERARIEREEQYILAQKEVEEAHYKHIDELLRQTKEKTKRKEPKKFLSLQRVTKLDKDEDISI